MIVLGERSDQYKQYFRSAVLAATVSNPHGTPIEQNIPIYVCHTAIEPLGELWPRFKMII
jgi:hypothetical protein